MPPVPAPHGAPSSTPANCSNKLVREPQRSRRRWNWKSWSSIHRRAAGIDLGSAENYVAVPPKAVAPDEAEVRVFGAFSEQQDALVEWLRTCQITTVALEATGIYWLTLYDKLEAVGIEVYLVDPHGVKAVPGRKSDWMDCQWLQKLHT